MLHLHHLRKRFPDPSRSLPLRIRCVVTCAHQVTMNVTFGVPSAMCVKDAGIHALYRRSDLLLHFELMTPSSEKPSSTRPPLLRRGTTLGVSESAPRLGATPPTAGARERALERDRALATERVRRYTVTHRHDRGGFLCKHEKRPPTPPFLVQERHRWAPAATDVARTDSPTPRRPAAFIHPSYIKSARAGSMVTVSGSTVSRGLARPGAAAPAAIANGAAPL